MYTKSFKSGGYISSYLHAINKDATPTNYNYYLVVDLIFRYLSIKYVVTYKVSSFNLNLRCTSTNQSNNIALILAFKSGCYYSFI